MISPIEAYSRLLNYRDPSKAAEVLEEHMRWHWSTVAYDPDAPSMVRNVADRSAWERFEATDPIAQKEVAAHCLFRAASCQTGTARARLIELAQSLVKQIIDAWLKDLTTGPKR
jgi:hypothetical protein